MRYLIAIFLLAFRLELSAQEDFLVKPYLQLGKNVSAQSIQLVWHATISNDTWQVEYKNNGDPDWKKATGQTASAIAVKGTAPFTVYSTTLTSLTAGQIFQYRVSKNDKVVFNSEGKALKSADQSYRIVISGDMGAGTTAAKRIAFEMYKARPDMVAIAGDIAYSQGLISDYKTKFWPVYNKDIADTSGAPLMRSIPFVAAVGNHDALTRDFDRYPDALAYYHFWDQPLNGPNGKEGGKLVPVLIGSDSNKKAFYDAAGNKYPRMTNFSFDYGNAHWTVIDSDSYVDWTDSTLRDWVIKDLEAATGATWRFVLFHHPGFNSSKAHFEDQQMRVLSPLFEKGKVDIVFAGHVHNYQRTYPLTFVPDNAGNQVVSANNTRVGKIVNGKWTLDENFNGKRRSKPNGIIYIVTGAGGQSLYNPEQTKEKNTWQKFTRKFESRIHSFTVMDVNGSSLTLRQLDINGNEIDKIKITK